MGGSIPYSIRRSVIKQWLEGLPRDQIAKVNQIATGTVSAIVKGCKEPDPEFILLREVAVILNHHRLDLALFSPLIRLGRLIG
jgi:replicative superfamily II helicase